MSLPTQNWEKYPEQVVDPFTVEDILDAIFTALSSATLANGDTPVHPIVGLDRFRAGGTVTESVYGAFTGGAGYGVGTPKFILCGAAGAKTPTMRSPDVWVVETLMGMVVKNAGAYNAWDNAAPFTTGDFAGMMRSAAPNLGTPTTVRVYVGIEGIIVECARPINNSFFKLGALWDPETTQAVSAESDGRIYGALSSASAGNSIDINYVNGAGGVCMSHSNSNGTAHCGSYTPGTAGWNFMDVVGGATLHNGSTKKNRSGGVVGVAIHHQIEAGTYVGRLRECFWGPDERTGYIIDVAGTDFGYIIGAKANAVTGAHFIKA
jgi:hypothetical protein